VDYPDLRIWVTLVIPVPLETDPGLVPALLAQPTQANTPPASQHYV
jgi:hypothetical protein